MTERKPRGMSFTSWIDQQINEAEERGLFDNLPGQGKPLPDPGEADFGEAWLRDYVRREGVPAEELLPTPLRLRKDAERLAERVPDFRTEREVREAVADLNERIMDWRRLPLGPPIFVPLVDEELTVGRGPLRRVRGTRAPTRPRAAGGGVASDRLADRRIVPRPGRRGG